MNLSASGDRYQCHNMPKLIGGWNLTLYINRAFLLTLAGGVLSFLILHSVLSFKYKSTVVLSGDTLVFSSSLDYAEATQAMSKVDTSVNTTNLLTLFTTFKEDPLRDNIQINTIHNWAMFQPDITPILFTSSFKGNLIATAKRKGWQIAPVPATNEYGTPLWKNMYSEAINISKSHFYAYCNGDILFTNKLIRTLKDILPSLPRYGPTLIIGRRTNVYFDAMNTTLVHHEAILNEISYKKKLYRPDAQDYFIIGNVHKFPWAKIKDVVIGRPAYDNYVVSIANQMHPEVTVIDATRTVLAVHLSGNNSKRQFSGSHNTDARYNRKVVGKGFNWRIGTTKRVRYFTDFSEEGNVKVKLRVFKTKSQQNNETTPANQFTPGHLREAFTNQTVTAKSPSDIIKPNPETENDSKHL